MAQSSVGVPTRALGRSGEQVSILGLGGWHIRLIENDRDALRLMHTAIDEGLTFFDNAWDYHDGASEELMGKALKMDNHRERVFLMSKVCDRDYEGAKRNLEDSLRRLQTDVIDLWQFHEINYDIDPDWVFDRGGIRAAIEAREQGKIRYIGFTGHKDPRAHQKMLRQDFAWDTIQLPNNVLDQHFESYRELVVPTCLERGIGVIGMKGLGGGAPNGNILQNMDLSVEQLLQYCWSRPVSTQVMGINSMEQLRQDLAAARSVAPLSETQAESLAARVREAASHGRFEPFKSTTDFDGPHHKKQREAAAV